jgi:cyclohexanecarboxyl-CoA dehydrogenase
MEFKFSKKEELIQWAVNDFAQRELTDKKLDSLDHVPKEIVKKMGDLGFLSMKIPEKHGGKPATWVMMGILTEEVAKVSAVIANLIMVSYEVSLSLASHGTEEAAEEWLSPLVKGEKLGCISVTEPGCGTDVNAIRTEAIRERDSYLIRGEKSPVSFGIQADVTLLFARTGIEPGTKGMTSFLLPLDLPGITKGPIANMGLSASAPSSLTMDKVRLPLKYRVGQEGEGLSINERMGLFSDLGRILSGLICLGLAQTALRSAVSYGKERVAFGRPIVKFEAISNKIAEDATFIEAGRWLCYRALSLKDQGLSNAKEAAMCGWWCPKVAFQVIENAILIHGHTGFSDDLPLQQMMRDAIAFEMISGTEQLTKLIIAQNIAGRSAVPDGLAEFLAP